MAVTRRLFVSGAMAMPLLGQMGGTAHAAADPAFTLLDGLGELRATELARTRLAAEGIEIQAVAPAVPITGADGAVTGVKMTPEYATGTIALTGRPSAGSAVRVSKVVSCWCPPRHAWRSPASAVPFRTTACSRS